MREIAAAAALWLLCGHTLAQDPPSLAIKGLQPGMTREAAKAAMPPSEGFTFAGVRPLVAGLPLVIRYQSDVISSITFVFKPADFDRVKNALQERYPKMTCTASTVSNQMGAAVEQTACKLSEGGHVLTAQRYAGRLDMASVDLRAEQTLTDALRQRRQDAGDT